MISTDVMIVRIYITESSHLEKKIVDYLVKEAQIPGVTVFRGISGVGQTGVHNASLLDISLDLPLTIEFFDNKEKASIAIEHLGTFIKPDHIIFWEAQKF